MLLQRLAQAGWATLCTAICLASFAAAADPAATTLDRAAFEQLKGLAGTWQGRVATSGDAPVTVEFEVTSNGHAVLERQFAGSSHEMVTMYYLAYDRLQATHYCSAGNQPAFKLASDSTPRDVRMEFAGGTGFDPATDSHVNGERIEVLGPDQLRVEYEFRSGQQAPTSQQLLLQRAAAAPVPAPVPDQPGPTH
jgi:hypothetical protein